MTAYDKFGSRFDGSWANNVRETDQERFTKDRPTDPAHGDDSKAPAPLMQDAPQAQPGGEIYTDATFFQSVAPSIAIDTTPAEGNGNPESVGHGVGGFTMPGATPGQLGAPRGLDYGAAARATRSTTIYRFISDLYYTVMPRAEEPPPITHGNNNPVFIRGINGHPANDGPGRPWSWSVTPGESWHRGENYDVSNVQRSVFHPPRWNRTAVRVQEPDAVTIIGDAPAPDQWDSYASPWSSLQKFMPKRRKVRGIRRDPGPWDEDMQASDPITYGPSADGMIVR